MDDKKAQNGKRDGNKWTPLVVAVVGAMLGSSGTVALVFNSPVGQQITRPDPFTGTQAAALIARQDELEEDIRNHFILHPDRALELRLGIMESNYKHVVETLDRIERKLDGR